MKKENKKCDDCGQESEQLFGTTKETTFRCKNCHEKKECECVKYCGNIKGVCTHDCHEWNTIPDPLTSLLQSAIERHKRQACRIADMPEYDPVNMTRFVENPLVRALVYQHIDSVRELTEAFNKGKQTK